MEVDWVTWSTGSVTVEPELGAWDVKDSYDVFIGVFVFL